MGRFIGKLSKKFSSNSKEKEIKCVVVGDNNVGKTKLIISYVYPASHPACDASVLTHYAHGPTIFTGNELDRRTLNWLTHKLGKYSARLVITDTFGGHQQDREYSYRKANVILLCFSLGNLNSLENVVTHWYPEVRKFCPKTPVLLVGTQADRRHNDPSIYGGNSKRIPTLREYLNPSSTIVSSITPKTCIEPELARKLSVDIGALLYYETSISTRYGIDELFLSALKVGLTHNVKAQRSEARALKLELLQVPHLVEKRPAVPMKLPDFIDGFDALLDGLYSPYEQTSMHDVAFVFGGETVYAHSVILAWSIPIFYKLFTGIHMRTPLYSDREEGGILSYSVRELIGDDYGVFSTVTVIETTARQRNMYSICMTNIRLPAFCALLEFHYKGKVESFDQQDFDDVLVWAIAMEMDLVQIYLRNVISGNIPTLRSVCPKHQLSNLMLGMGEWFLNWDCLADVEFQLKDGLRFPAHKVILSHRSKMFRAMFDDRKFLESSNSKVDFRDTNLESFESVLEYLYTGDCKRMTDQHGTLKLANFLCLPRLVAMCEIRISSEIESMVKDGSEVYAYVIASYILGEYHNAPQLLAWCKHFMATNYNDLCRHQGKQMKSSLDEDTLKDIEQNRWPPVWYLKEQDYYERTVKQMTLEQDRKKEKKRKRTCSCLYRS